MKCLRTRVRLLAATWLLAQAVCLARPLWVAGDGLATLMAAPKCTDPASTGQICPMRQPDGTSCPMHRAVRGLTACKLTSACGHSDESLGAARSPLALPLAAAAFPITFASTRVLVVLRGVPHTLRTSPDAPPPRA